MRFREASLLTKEKFEIPFLEKNVPPGNSLYGGFLVHAVGFWSMQRVSACGDSALVGILFGSCLGKSCWGDVRERPKWCASRPSFIVVLPSNLGLPWVFTYRSFLFGNPEAPFQELERRTSLSDHLGSGKLVST